MSRKLALSLLLIVLGLATWDATFDHNDVTRGAGDVKTMEDGTDRPPIRN